MRLAGQPMICQFAGQSRHHSNGSLWSLALYIYGVGSLRAIEKKILEQEWKSVALAEAWSQQDL